MERLYGRADVLERARPLVERACAGRGQVLLFTGEAGIGKSRLAEHLAEQAAARGARVAWGRAWEAGGAPAYWPWIQVFRELELGDDPFGGAGPALAAAAEEARFSAFDRAVACLRAAAAATPLVLVLDDLHAADVPSLLLLLLLARQLQGTHKTPLLVVGAYRDAQTRATPELAALLGKLAREAEVLPLERLSAEHVAAWARDSGIAGGDARAEELYRVTEGHPLFVVELLRLGKRAGVPGASLPMGPGVLDERLGAISRDTRALLQVASVLGRDFSASDLAATADGVSADRVSAAVSEALTASIVVPADARAEYRFSHVLVRDRLYEELAPSAREALHARAGMARLARGAAPEAAIHHLFEAHGAAAPEVVAEVALAAARAELTRLAFEDALQLGRRALALRAEPCWPDRLRAELRLVLAEAAIRLGDNAEGKRLCNEASELAERAGESELLARAALVYGTELASGTVDLRMVALLRQALAQLGSEPSPLRARVMARLAAALTPPLDASRGSEIVELVRGASGMAQALGDPHALLYVLHFGATVALLVPEQERFSRMTETMALARALDQRLVLLSTLPAYVTALLARGERQRAEAELPAYDALLSHFHQPLHRVRRLLVDALLSALSGHFDECERASAEAHALARLPNAGPSLLLWLTHRLALAQLLARPELATAEAPQLLAAFQSTPSAVPYAAWLLAASDRREEAAANLREQRLEPLEVAPANLMDLMGAAEAAMLLGDRELAEVLYPRLARASDRMLWNMGPGALLGPTGRVLGDLAVFVGRPSEAARHYEAALAFAEKLASPPLVELCRRGRQAALAALAGAPEAASPLPAPSGAEELAGTRPSSPVPASALPRTPASTPRPELRREGELWVIETQSGSTRLKHSKGLVYLERLMQREGRPVHVLELVGIEHYTGDAGAVLDPRAKAQYKQRLGDLGDALREAESFDDAARAARIQVEIDALAEQLAAAVGLGGRDRRAASDVERTRVNVQRRLKDVIDRIAATDAGLGRYLAAAIRTGTYCVYQPP